mmetsp:Transcript_4910/g.15080  ORF Transcript_4910/g.15080 Transcript_4910/m.15080 type:complete len:211 (+) Transcript_4910:253-885(+)
MIGGSSTRKKTPGSKLTACASPLPKLLPAPSAPLSSLPTRRTVSPSARPTSRPTAASEMKRTFKRSKRAPLASTSISRLSPRKRPSALVCCASSSSGSGRSGGGGGGGGGGEVMFAAEAIAQGAGEREGRPLCRRPSFLPTGGHRLCAARDLRSPASGGSSGTHHVARRAPARAGLRRWVAVRGREGQCSATAAGRRTRDPCCPAPRAAG